MHLVSLSALVFATNVLAAEPSLQDSSSLTKKAPKSFVVTLDTTQGEVVIEVNRKWAPEGATRHLALGLLRRRGFLSGNRRVYGAVWHQWRWRGQHRLARRFHTRRPRGRVQRQGGVIHEPVKPPPWPVQPA
jgi:hypothetical protein